LHVIASTNPEGGGPIEGVKQRGRVLHEMGHPIEIACFDAPDAPWLSQVGFPVHALGPASGGYGFTPRLRPWLQNHAGEYDGVVVNGIWQYHALAARQAMQALGRPYVLFTHGMLDPWFKRTFPLKHLKKVGYWLVAEHWNLRHAAAVLFTTEEERVLARQSFAFYRAKERVVSYGTAGPPGELDPCRTAFLKRFSELDGKQFLLFLSRIHPKKGCDLLIRAFADVFADHPDMRLVMAGPDQTGWRSELEQLAESLGVAERIIWPGMLSGDLKWGAYAACEAFVLPSHQENFGIVVAEALACGKPVLISNKVNIWREVDAAGAGLVADDSLKGTCGLLQRWQSSSSQERERMRAAAMDCFNDNFEIGQSVRSLLEVLEDVIADHAIPAATRA
jgi:glycosyltransferase involved in cell wall biosynthesis